MFDSLRLTNLPTRHCAVLRKHSSTRPALWIVEEDGVRAVVKDFSANGFLFCHVIGRFLVWREAKALRRLKGVQGVPVLYRIVDGIALIMEKIPGRNLEEVEREQSMPKAFFDEMKDLVDRFHQRGVAHCNLKRAPNTLVGPDNTPYIIDWGAAIFHSEFRVFPLHLVYRRFLQDDYMAIIKQKLRHCPEAVSPEESACYSRQSRMELLIRRMRDRLREWLQRVA